MKDASDIVELQDFFENKGVIDYAYDIVRLVDRSGVSAELESADMLWDVPSNSVKKALNEIHSMKMQIESISTRMIQSLARVESQLCSEKAADIIATLDSKFYGWNDSLAY